MIIASGQIGNHGIAIMSARENTSAAFESDAALEPFSAGGCAHCPDSRNAQPRA